MPQKQEPTTPETPDSSSTPTTAASATHSAAPPQSPSEPTPDPDPTTRELRDDLTRLESKLDRLIAQGATLQETRAVAEAIDQTEAAILETPASGAATLEPATAAATDGTVKDASSPAVTAAPAEPLTAGRKRKRGLGKRSRA